MWTFPYHSRDFLFLPALRSFLARKAWKWNIFQAFLFKYSHQRRDEDVGECGKVMTSRTSEDWWLFETTLMVRQVRRIKSLLNWCYSNLGWEVLGCVSQWGIVKVHFKVMCWVTCSWKIVDKIRLSIQDNIKWRHSRTTPKELIMTLVQFRIENMLKPKVYGTAVEALRDATFANACLLTSVHYIPKPSLVTS